MPGAMPPKQTEVTMKEDTEHTQLNVERWDRWAESFDGGGRVHRYLRDCQSRVIALLDVREDIHFLDVGCGTGWAIRQAATLANNKGVFYGVDLSPKMIEKAKENFGGEENFHFIDANAESIPLDGEFFDIIICTNSFHHYLHPDQAINEFYRLLRTGGKVYIVDATTDAWYMKIIDRIMKLLETGFVKFYSTKEYQQLFHSAGLTYSASKRVRFNNKVHIGEK
jgi:ubiquinone/menaquinone biosynthesis C-methylase UbiE